MTRIFATVVISIGLTLGAATDVTSAVCKIYWTGASFDH
jgi:hypothetical protein